jgi:hypothetical protein
MYELKEPFWRFIDHWQTLIAGLLALAAGVGAVWATIKSANREIAAAQEQTKAAQRQTAVTREIERRRIAREGYAFHAMLEAAMGAVIEDVEAARNLPPPSPGSHSAQAFAVRQRVKRAGFTELRNAFLRFGGSLTAQYGALSLVCASASFRRTALNVASAIDPAAVPDSSSRRVTFVCSRMFRLPMMCLVLRPQLHPQSPRAQSSFAPVFCSGIALRISPAQRAASTTLRNSASRPSPVFLTVRPWCSLICGSTSSRRCALSRWCVPSSSAPISRE